jgi:flagellar P-ring protein precursor FlgI
MKKNRFLFAFIVAIGLLPWSAHAMRIKDLADISGQRPNQLVGYGLVVGLDGTGDAGGVNPVTGRSIVTMLSSLGVSVPADINLQARNAAAVIVTAELDSLVQPGQAMDVTVSSLGNAKSLRGGTLIMTPLKAADGQIYAQAQGAVVVPGAEVTSSRSRISINQQSVGRIPAGAIVEQAAPIGQLDSQVAFNFRQSDFVQMQRAINAARLIVGFDNVQAQDARTLLVKVPDEPTRRTEVMARLLEAEIDPPKSAAKVIINARTGSVVVNESVDLAPFAVTHGNLTIKVQGAVSAVQTRKARVVRSSGALSVGSGPVGQMIEVQGSASLEAVVRAINMLGATPQDLMAILQAMKQAGALRAELEII